MRERASYACPNTEEILRCTSLVRLYVAVCNLPYTGGHHVRFPELLELGLCSTGLCQEDFDRVLAGSPKLENLAFISGRVALTRIDLVCPRLRCVVFWHAVPSHELAMVDAPCLERVILWEEDTYSLVPCKIKIGCAPVLRAIGYLNPILHVLQIGDQLITVSICGSTACVNQTAWIRNGTIQENILFVQPMHLEKYREIIHACCLEKDLEMMEFGDQTEIGERGIKLSGGQKQRIQLARAVYQDCDIYLLDDIFSAVDAHTGSAIFKECLKGILKSKTVLLVTHQVDFLQNVDAIFVMKNGGIIQSANYGDLLDSCSDFVALVAAHHSSMEASGVQGHNIQNTKNCPATTMSQETPSVNSNSSNVNSDTNDVVLSKEAGSSKLIQEEEKESGRLLCLGRVMLKRSRVLFMDEATASVDSQTDTVIQMIIREEFRECTVISISHCVPTVMDSDRVLVLDAGLVKEFDAPSKLMGRPSVFGAMVQEYSSRSSQATD
ncbi:hypothetical protein ZWY2020_026354 [Hordeum vulgare]|nr:hypothetical protein ZWY2020_026354 [Hordeum vulgare]